MFSGNYTKLNTILQRVRSIIPNSVEINRSDAVEWVWNAVSEIAERGVFYELEKFIEVRDNKAELPSNLEGLISASYVHDDPNDIDNPSEFEYNRRVLMDTASEPFMTDYDTYYSNDEDSTTNPRGYRYFIKNGYIYTTFEEGIIQLHYTAFPTDESGEPLIPKTMEAIQAVTWYIIYQLYTRQFYKDSQFGAQLQHAEVMWETYGNKARIQMLTPNDDKMHEIYQKTARIVPLGLWRRNKYDYNDNNLISQSEVSSLLNPST